MLYVWPIIVLFFLSERSLTDYEESNCIRNCTTHVPCCTCLKMIAVWKKQTKNPKNKKQKTNKNKNKTKANKPRHLPSSSFSSFSSFFFIFARARVNTECYTKNGPSYTAHVWRSLLFCCLRPCISSTVSRNASLGRLFQLNIKYSLFKNWVL